MEDPACSAIVPHISNKFDGTGHPLRLELIDEADAGAPGQEALHAAGPASDPYLARRAVIRRRSARPYAIPEHTLSRAIARTTTL